MVVNPTTSLVDTEMIAVELMPCPMMFSDKAKVMIRCDVRAEGAKPFKLRFGPLSCVTVIAGLLGLSSGFVYTPKQLMNKLKVIYGRPDRQV